MYKRMISLLLCLVMVCSLLPVGVFAEEEIPEGIVPEAEVESFDAPVPAPEENNAVTSIEIPFRVNPLYAGQISVAEPAREGESAALFAAPVYGTVAEGKATLREGMKARMPQVKVYVSTTEEDLSAVFYEMFYGAMEHNGDPAAGDYLKYQYASYSGSVEWDWDNNVIFTYDLAYCDTPEQQDVMDSAVAMLLGQLNLYGKSDYEKICGIYDWMCANITYDYDNLEDDSYLLMYTAYAALVNRTAVCQGYANLFYRLALELGVDSRIISGTGISNTGSGPHAWNIVKLSGSYYDVDATWDATWKQAGLEYDWFLKNEAEFSQDHVRAADFTTAAFQNAYPMATEDYTPPVPETPNYVDQGTCGDNLTWTLTEDGVLTISGEGDMSWSGNAPWYDYRESVKTAVIGDGVVGIRSGAFRNHINMTGVTIADTVKYLRDNAFENCTSLKDITIGEGVTFIGESVFLQCTSLTTVLIPASVQTIGWTTPASCQAEMIVDEANSSYSNDQQGVLFNKEKTILLRAPGTLSGVYTIPDSVQEIWGHAFSGCAGLTGVEIPDSVKALQAYVFRDCVGLSRITIPASVEAVGMMMFDNCSGLTEIWFEGDAPRDYAASSRDDFFGNTTAMVYYPADNETWTEEYRKNYSLLNKVTWMAYDGKSAYSEGLEYTLSDDGTYYIVSGIGTCTDTDIIIPETHENLPVKEIATFAFDQCVYLTSVVIPDSVISIGDYAFEGCTSLISVKIGRSVERIDKYVFRDCTALVEILVDEANTAYSSDAQGALYNKDKTQLILVPCSTQGAYIVADSVIEILEKAFYRCSNLTEVTIPASVAEIGENVFGFCTGLTAFRVDEGNEFFCSEEDGVLFNKEKTKLLYYPGGKTGAYTVPEMIRVIGEAAFYGASALEGVFIPEGVTTIEGWAFSYCTGLTEVEIPGTVTTLGDAAFAQCYNLTKVTIPDSVTKLPNWLFNNCIRLMDVTIPASVTSIETFAFYYCVDLTEITFEGDAPEFKNDAFFDVTATAYYPANNETWTEDVRQNYGGTITWVAYADGMAKIGDVAYATVADALEAAEVGDTVTLLQNAEEDTVTVCKGITLDLNSYALTADYVFAVNGSNIVDNSSDNTGVLVVNPDHMMISSGNSDLPIWNGEGFIFVDILYFQELYTTNEAGQKQYVFLPSFETIAHQYLVQGMENSHVKIAIRMTWEIDTGSAFQNFVYNDKTVKAVISSYDGSYYEKVFYATITNSEYADFDLKVVLISDTGVELMLN